MKRFSRRATRVLFVTAFLSLVVAATPIAQMASEADRREALQRYRAGVEYLSAEQWERAAEEFRRAIKLDRLFTDAHFGLGQAYMGMQRFASAVVAFEGCLEAARDLHSLRAKGRMAGDKQLDDDIRELRETIRQMASLGGRDLQRLQLDQRVADLERSRSSLGKNFEPPAAVLLSFGSAHFRHGDREKAEKAWGDAVRVNSKLGEGWNNLAVIYMLSGRRSLAENAVRQAERAGFRVNPRLKDDIKAMNP